MKYRKSIAIARFKSRLIHLPVRGVINETLRLFPPVPLNVRESRSTSFSLPRSDGTYKVPSEVPLYMPAKTTIMYFPLLTQRNQRLWGEDAEEFDPERWIDPQRLTKFTANPTMYTPFSAGPRIVSTSTSSAHSF